MLKNIVLCESSFLCFTNQWEDLKDTLLKEDVQMSEVCLHAPFKRWTRQLISSVHYDADTLRSFDKKPKVNNYLRHKMQYSSHVAAVRAAAHRNDSRACPSSRDQGLDEKYLQYIHNDFAGDKIK